MAGPMIEESVSVPKERGTMFADTATADPELEPTGVALTTLSDLYGQRGHTWTAGEVVRIPDLTASR